VPVHRRQLPIVGPCEEFVPAPGAVGAGGFCERCCKQVHDVSAMREPELRRFLAARVGTRVCLAYRTDAAGLLQLRPEPAAVRPDLHPLAVGALAVLLAACAGHVTELEAPGAVCHDADGYEVSCPTWPEPGMHSVPEVREPEVREPDQGPVRPTVETGVEDELPLEPVEPVEPAPTTANAAPAAQGTSVHARVNFSVDPAAEDRMLVGIVMVDSGWIDRDFVPTAELWKEWRQRRAERKAARLRWREHQRAVTSR
jgi:hypothetical protein